MHYGHPTVFSCLCETKEPSTLGQLWVHVPHWALLSGSSCFTLAVLWYAWLLLKQIKWWWWWHGGPSCRQCSQQWIRQWWWRRCSSTGYDPVVPGVLVALGWGMFGFRGTQTVCVLMTSTFFNSNRHTSHSHSAGSGGGDGSSSSSISISNP